MRLPHKMQFEHAFIETVAPPILADAIRCDQDRIGAGLDDAAIGMDLKPDAAAFRHRAPDRDDHAQQAAARKIKPRLLTFTRYAREIAKPAQGMKRPPVY